MNKYVKFGLNALNLEPYSSPGLISKVATMAEAANFESLWVIDHTVLPDPVPLTGAPLAPSTHVLAPVITLSYLAALTRKIMLATGVVVLPQRNPLILAKEIATLDVLSSGRAILGVGVGYFEPEFEALGVPMRQRGSRADEYLDAILAIWSVGKATYHGEFVHFESVKSNPRPVQAPHPPLIVGGRSDAAFRRAVTYADGWYGYGLDLVETAHYAGELQSALRHIERPKSLSACEITITPEQSLDLDMAEKYADLGVTRLNLNIPEVPSDSELSRFFDYAASNLINKVAIRTV